MNHLQSKFKDMFIMEGTHPITNRFIYLDSKFIINILLYISVLEVKRKDEMNILFGWTKEEIGLVKYWLDTNKKLRDDLNNKTEKIVFLTPNETNFSVISTFLAQITDEKDNKDRSILIIVQDDFLNNKDNENKITTLLLSSNRIFAKMEQKRWIEETISSISDNSVSIWYILDSKRQDLDSLFHSNVYLDILEIGKLVQNPKLQDFTYLNHYTPKSGIEELFKNHIVQMNERIYFPRVTIRKFQNNHEMTTILISIQQFFFTNFVYPNLSNSSQGSKMMEKLNHDYEIVKELKKNWTHLNSSYLSIVNEMIQFLNYSELFFWEPLISIQMMKKEIGVQSKFSLSWNKLLEKFLSRIKKMYRLVPKPMGDYNLILSEDSTDINDNNKKYFLPNKIIQLYKVILKWVTFERKNGKLEIIILPDLYQIKKLETLIKIMIQKRLRIDDEREIKGVYFITQKDTINTLNNKLEIKTNEGKIIIFKFSDFQRLSSPSNPLFSRNLIRIHYFFIRASYSPILQRQLIPYFNVEKGVHPLIICYVGNTRMEQLGITHILHRKSEVLWELTRMTKNTIDSKTFIGIPMIKMDEFPYVEPVIGSIAKYDTDNLTVIEIIKFLSLYTYKTRIIPFVQKMTYDGVELSFNKDFRDELKSLENNQNKQSSFNQLKRDLFDEYLMGKKSYRINEEDLIGFIHLIPILTALYLKNKDDDIEILLETILNLLAFFLIKISQKGNTNQFKPFLLLKEEWNKLYNISKYLRKKEGLEFGAISKNIMNSIDKIMIAGDENEESKIKTLVSLKQFELHNKATMIMNRYFVNPLSLAFLGLVTRNTQIGWKLILPRLLHWLSLYRDREDSQKFRIIIEKITKKMSSTVHSGTFVPHYEHITDALFYF